MSRLEHGLKTSTSNLIFDWIKKVHLRMSSDRIGECWNEGPIPKKLLVSFDVFAFGCDFVRGLSHVELELGVKSFRVALTSLFDVTL